MAEADRGEWAIQLAAEAEHCDGRSRRFRIDFRCAKPEQYRARDIRVYGHREPDLHESAGRGDVQLFELVCQPGSRHSTNRDAHDECQQFGGGDIDGEDEAFTIAAEARGTRAAGVRGDSWIRIAGFGTPAALLPVALDGSSAAVWRTVGGHLPDGVRRRQCNGWRRNTSDTNSHRDWNFRKHGGIDLQCADGDLAQPLLVTPPRRG